MENATKALLMAAGILISIILITVMMILFTRARSVGNIGKREADREQIESFNINFTQYIGKELTIYDAVSICKYADSVHVTVINPKRADPHITDEVNLGRFRKYSINVGYNADGYINTVTIVDLPDYWQ